MKKTDLNIFLYLGQALGELKDTSTEMEWIDFYITTQIPADWVEKFLRQTKDVKLPESRAAMLHLQEVLSSLRLTPGDPKRPMRSDEIAVLHRAVNGFEEIFESESELLDVFTVTPKGLYDTRMLVSNTEEKFPENVRKHFTKEMLYDLHQAGRCLAFDVPTACAFHMYRFVEALALLYYEKLAKQPWSLSGRDLGKYIQELNKLPNVNAEAMRRLDEIRKWDRNPTIHPEYIVPLERAPILFELCTGAIFTIGEAIDKI